MQILTFDEAARSRLMELLDAKSKAHNTMRCDEVQGFYDGFIERSGCFESRPTGCLRFWVRNLCLMPKSAPKSNVWSWQWPPICA